MTDCRRYAAIRYGDLLNITEAPAISCTKRKLPKNVVCTRWCRVLLPPPPPRAFLAPQLLAFPIQISHKHRKEGMFIEESNMK